jgi:excisionase family DNA binding protein
LTVTEVAHKMTVYRLVHDGTLPAMHIDNSYRVATTALQDYLNLCGAATA